MRTLLIVLTLGYAATCIVAGLLGIFTASAEMERFYHLQPDAMAGLRAADLMGQFGFMKALEFGLGLFIIARLGPILEGGSERSLFALIVAAGLLARTIAWLSYGRPSSFFLLFFALEVAVLAVLLQRPH